MRERHKVRRQLTWSIEPVFPGYLFARFVIEGRFRAVHYTLGVILIVTSPDLF